MQTKVYFGTGTAPSNGAATTGTQIANVVLIDEASAGFHYPVTNGGIVTGLTPGTAYWFDLNQSTTGGTVTLIDLSCNAMEF
jgi:hypothetical protein